MSVNIISDFKENGVDKNQPHIVPFTDDVYVAGLRVKEMLESQGCIVQALAVVKGNYTLDELHNMAQYGEGLEQADYRLIYTSSEMLTYFQFLANSPAEAEKEKQEIENRRQRRQRRRDAKKR